MHNLSTCGKLQSQKPNKITINNDAANIVYSGESVVMYFIVVRISVESSRLVYFSAAAPTLNHILYNWLSQ